MARNQLSDRRGVQELLAAAKAQKARGADFPSLWHGLLRGHPLVAGMPVQVLIGSEPALEISLITGQTLIMHGGVIDLRP